MPPEPIVPPLPHQRVVTIACPLPATYFPQTRHRHYLFAAPVHHHHPLSPSSTPPTLPVSNTSPVGLPFFPFQVLIITFYPQSSLEAVAGRRFR
jgi:hypothetical protein